MKTVYKLRVFPVIIFASLELISFVSVKDFASPCLLLYGFPLGGLLIKGGRLFVVDPENVLLVHIIIVLTDM